MALIAIVVGLVGFEPACETNACLPSTTCVSGPLRSETFSAAVPTADAAIEDATADAAAATVDSGAPDGPEPSDGAAEAEPEEASDP
jgi:hypothetical protein